MSNPYSAEILRAVASRIKPERLEAAHTWVRNRLRSYGMSGMLPEAIDLVAWGEERDALTAFTAPNSWYEALYRLHSLSVKATPLLRLPSAWLLASLIWSLDPQAAGDAPDEQALDAHSIARVYGTNGLSYQILSKSLSADADDPLAAMSGMFWSLGCLATWTGVIIRVQADPSADLAAWSPARLAAEMLGDLRNDILSDDRMEEFRDLSRRRRARAAQGGEGPEEADFSGVDLDLKTGVREIVDRAEHRAESPEGDGQGDKG